MLPMTPAAMMRRRLFVDIEMRRLPLHPKAP